MKKINSNAQLKLRSDLQKNWDRAISFIPLKGEAIVYLPDDNNPSPRLKIGDGITTVGALNFVSDLTILDQYYTKTQSDAKYFNKTTGGTVSGDVVISGSLLVKGSSAKVKLENIAVESNFIETNANKTPLANLTGLALNKGKNATTNVDQGTYLIVYDASDESDAVKLGFGSDPDADGNYTFLPGEGYPIATREDSSNLQDNQVMLWDAATCRLKGSSDYYTKSQIDAGYSTATNLRNGTSDNTLILGGNYPDHPVNIANQKFAVSLGAGSKATAEVAFATGYETEASGSDSFTSGFKTRASAAYTFAANLETQATAEASAAFGHDTLAQNTASFVAGLGTKSGRDNQTVVGQYNQVSSVALFVVGVGTENSRKTGLQVNDTGTVTLGADPNGNMHAVTLRYLQNNYVKRLSPTYNSLYATNKGTQTYVGYDVAPLNGAIPLRDVNGTIQVGTPISDNHAVTKKYVDDFANSVMTESYLIDADIPLNKRHKIKYINTFYTDSSKTGYYANITWMPTGFIESNKPFSFPFIKRDFEVWYPNNGGSSEFEIYGMYTDPACTIPFTEIPANRTTDFTIYLLTHEYARWSGFY